MSELPTRTDADEFADRILATRELLRYFEYAHLPAHLQDVSRPCGELAKEMVRGCPDGWQLTAGLLDLLRAKDCFVRAALG